MTNKEQKPSEGAESTIYTAIANYLKAHYDVRYNALRMVPEILRGKVHVEVNDYLFNSLFIELVDAGFKVTDQILHKVLASQLTRVVNPLQEYFEALPEWDGQDYIGELAQTITIDGEEEEMSAQLLWERMLKTFLIGLVATAISKRSCQLCLVLTGGQGVGKSTWLDKLCPPELRQKFAHTGGITPKVHDKATVDLLTEKLLIHLDDQLEGFNSREFEGLKSIITSTRLNSRKPYQRNDDTRTRRASIVASTNNPNFLTDTENRRYLVFSCKAIDLEEKVDRNMVLAQALALYKEGEQYWLNSEDQRLMRQYTSRFRSAPIEEELVLKYLKPAAIDDPETEWRMTSEIKSALEHYSGQKNLSMKMLGKSLGALHFVKKSMRSKEGSPRKNWGVVPQEGLQFN